MRSELARLSQRHPAFEKSGKSVAAGLTPERRSPLERGSPRSDSCLELMLASCNDPSAVNEEGNKMKRRLLGVLAASVVATASVGSAGASSNSVRLVRVTSPVSAGSYATLVARVSPSRVTCSITVYYKSGPSHAAGLYSKRPVAGRVSWTWKVGTRTTPGRWPIRVSCGAAGVLRTSFRTT
jgi:hypothetical protein